MKFLFMTHIFDHAYGSEINNSQSQIDRVLDFWFGPLDTREENLDVKNGIWFGRNVDFDNTIRAKFEPWVLSASKGEFESWKNTPRGRLALIILLDQFPRNIYRNTPQAFAFDGLAQQVAMEGILDQSDHQLLLVERVFFYLPLEHAENLTLQIMSVDKFKELVCEAPSKSKSVYESNLDYAIRHYEIIAKFGRFPHRNKILGRESTKKENAFLSEPNSSF